MQAPPEIVFEGLPATPQIKDAIDAHLAELERRWGRITACRCRREGTRSTATAKVVNMMSIYVSPSPTVEKSMSQGHRQRTSGIPT